MDFAEEERFLGVWYEWLDVSYYVPTLKMISFYSQVV